MSLKKILFYYSGVLSDFSIFVSTAHLYLKTFIDVNNPTIADKLEWLDSLQIMVSDDDLVAICNENKVDYLCTSHYIWNHEKLITQLQRVRPRLHKDIIVIVGGPSVDVNSDENFFVKYPFVDYAIYGPGEEAFNSLMEHLVQGKKPVAEFLSNLAVNQNGKRALAPFKYVKMLSTSPFVHNNHILKKTIGQLKQQGYHIAFPYEVTRGCPYACTFCDWNSGLSNKVSRRKGTYKEEIDLFYELGIETIYLSDANTGQFPEDIDLMEYFADQNLQHNSSIKIMGNFSKLNKDANLKIFHSMARGKLINQGFNIACQDIHPQILENIDRPDLTWEEHARMIDELAVQYPHIPCQIQLIQGLPGQSIDTWRQTLSTVSEKNTVLYIFISELLPASPAYTNPNYQEKFKFTYSNSLRYLGPTLSVDGNYFRGCFPESCVSFSREDFVAMTVMGHFYTAMCAVNAKFHQYGFRLSIEPIVDMFLESCYYKWLTDNLSHNWNNDHFFYTINFDGTSALLSGCVNHHPGYQWVKTKAFQNFIQEFILDPTFRYYFNSYDWTQVDLIDRTSYS